MDFNQVLYVLELDGTIQRMYFWGWVGPRFALSVVKKPKLHDYKRWFVSEDYGKIVFPTRAEAKKAAQLRFQKEV